MMLVAGVIVTLIWVCRSFCCGKRGTADILYSVVLTCANWYWLRDD